MLNLNEQYITDKDGNRTAVVIPISKFEELQGHLTIQEDESDCSDVTDAIHKDVEDLKPQQTLAPEALRTLFKQTQQLPQIQTLTEDDIVAEIEVYRNNS